MIRIDRDGERLLVQGQLDNEADVASSLRRALESCDSDIVIEANHAIVTPDGVTKWIAASRLLEGRRVTYADSQLAMILQYDDRYVHSRSVFVDPFASVDNQSRLAAS